MVTITEIKYAMEVIPCWYNILDNCEFYIITIYGGFTEEQFSSCLFRLGYFVKHSYTRFCDDGNYGSIVLYKNI